MASLENVRNGGIARGKCRLLSLGRHKMRGSRRLWQALGESALFALTVCSAGHCQTAKPAPSASVPSIAEPLNHLLPRWVRFSGEFRDRAEGRTTSNFVPGSDNGYDLTRFRLNLELTPKQWLRFFVQGQDAQAPGIEEVSTERDKLC